MNILAPSENTMLWNKLFTTRPSVVKSVTGKGFKCSSAHPYWITSRMTEVFGANGQGWGIEVKDQGFERIDDENTHHWALVELWYMKDGKRCASQHMGGTKVKYMVAKDKGFVPKYDEDAPKKSVTDAFVKCASMLGLAGDIHSGMWEVYNYRSSAEKYWQEVDVREFGGQNQYANAEWIDTESKHAQVSENSGNHNNSNNTNQANQANQGQGQGQGFNIDQWLEVISNAKDLTELTRIFDKFQGSQYEPIIKQACGDKKNREGWIKKNNQQQPA